MTVHGARYGTSGASLDMTSSVCPYRKEPTAAMQLKKILVVEDSQLLQKLYVLVLRRYQTTGTEILSAFDGREGLNKLAANPDVDLIILDINMPEISGLEFLRLVKQEPRFAGIPVIIASTEGKEEDTTRGLQAGAVGYFVKPFQPEELHQLIERLLRFGGHGVARQVVPSLTTQRPADPGRPRLDRRGPASTTDGTRGKVPGTPK